MSVKTNNNIVVSMSCDFEWVFTVSSVNSWTVSSSVFTLIQLPNSCSLKMQATYYTSSRYYYHTLYVSMEFTNSLLMKNIDLIISDTNYKKKFIFHLTSEDDNPKVFSGTKEIYLQSLFSEKNYSWKFTLIYKNTPVLQRSTPYMDKKNILYNDFKELLESERHADFSIKAQNKTFKVHKGILSCRCEILAKAIESDMMEKKNNEMQLDQWDPAVIKEFLLFIYTGSCEVSMNPHQLFELANYYNLEKLKLSCVEYLQNNMNMKNIVHTLALADEEQYGLHPLKALAYLFVQNNEEALAKDVDFQDYLTQAISIKNLVFVLRLAHTYNLKGPLERAKEFIKQNYDKVLENKECSTYLSSQGELLLDILKYTIESSVQI